MAATQITVSSAKLWYGTDAEIIALTSGSGAGVGDVGYATDTNEEYSCVDATTPTWNNTRASVNGAAFVTTSSSPGLSGAYESAYYILDGGAHYATFAQAGDWTAADGIICLFSGFSITPTRARISQLDCGSGNWTPRVHFVIASVNQGAVANYTTLFNTIDNVGAAAISGGSETKMSGFNQPFIEFDLNGTEITDVGAMGINATQVTSPNDPVIVEITVW